MVKRFTPPVALLLVLLSALPGCRIERAEANRGITLEVAVFQGGFGIDWHKQVARDYERMHPDIKVRLWGDPRVDEKIKPRILRRDPPDLANCTLPVWKLILADKLYPLNETLDSPAYGQPGSWRQSLIPSVLTEYRYEDRIYAMPSNFGIWVGWYDRRLFRKHGWEPPRTWSEFTHLCEKIKAAGIAPVAFQGKYPYYAWSTLLALFQRLAPFEKFYAVQDAEPGAFLQPEFIRAASMLQEMSTKFFQPGAFAMTHTESQLEWVNGRAAIVFCGLWLKNEMKKALPDGFEMDCFAVPIVEGGKGDPNAVYGGGGENFFVFKDARHPKEAADFLKYMVSVEPARRYIQQLATLSPVKGAEKGLDLPSDLEGAVRIQQRATRNFNDRLTGLYLEFRTTTMPTHLSALLEGKITPEQFARRMEAGMESVRRNPEVYKPPKTGVPAL